jgi:hypothetical protein
VVFSVLIQSDFTATSAPLNADTQILIAGGNIAGNFTINGGTRVLNCEITGCRCDGSVSISGDATTNVSYDATAFPKASSIAVSGTPILTLLSDGSNIAYEPAISGNWPTPNPKNVGSALDILISKPSGSAYTWPADPALTAGDVGKFLMLDFATNKAAVYAQDPATPGVAAVFTVTINGAPSTSPGYTLHVDLAPSPPPLVYGGNWTASPLDNNTRATNLAAAYNSLHASSADANGHTYTAVAVANVVTFTASGPGVNTDLFTNTAGTGAVVIANTNPGLAAAPQGSYAPFLGKLVSVSGGIATISDQPNYTGVALEPIACAKNNIAQVIIVDGTHIANNGGAYGNAWSNANGPALSAGNIGDTVLFQI